MSKAVRLARIAAKEREAEALMATQAIAYAHGIDPNEWRAQRTGAIMQGISSVASSVAGVFSGKGGAPPSKMPGATGPGGQPAPKSSNTMLMVGAAVLVVVFMFFKK